LLHHPKVLFLDEPTLGLDPQTRNRIWEYIIELQRKEGTTIFLTTHYMDEADKADRIAIIDHGKLIAMDTPGNLKKMAGNDIISVKTADDDRAVKEIKLRYGIEASRSIGGVNFGVTSGEEFLPSFIKGFGIPILSVSLRRPSLEDVFLKLTGREIREEGGVGEMKAVAQMHGRRFRH
jgi:ABC-2 type transport system ATP-binding protein